MNAKGYFPKTTFPRIPGRDYAGVVVDVSLPSADNDRDSGNDNKNNSEEKEKEEWLGKKVYGTSGSTLGFTLDGVHAQFCLIPLTALVEKPSSLSLAEAATIGVPFITGLTCLKRSQVKREDTVLVLGARGGVGSATVQIARAMGCSVLKAARGGGDNIDIELPMGDTPNYSTLPSKISALTNGKGADIIIDTIGNTSLMAAAIPSLAFRGRYAWIAAPRALNISKEVSFDIFQAYRKEIQLVGCNTTAYSLEEIAGDIRTLGKWFEEGKLRPVDLGGFKKMKLEDAIVEGYLSTGSALIEM